MKQASAVRWKKYKDKIALWPEELKALGESYFLPWLNLFYQGEVISRVTLLQLQGTF